ncbi:hypothetical protein AB4Z42_22215 [Mycobacterium sp. 2YAF39]|uniref:hypothetical protein n=1 Tax=Mycobacterium sp. 2YAF39 TaxID=3233033 RepID=UPI003F9667ED
MSGEHPDLGPELRQLAQTILDRLDPALRIAAARAAASGAGASKCQQVWCPVCALAALASGEQHPLLTVVADHSVALLGVVRTLIENAENPGQPADAGQSGGVPPPPPPDGASPPEPPDGDPPPPPGPGRYQHIPVTVEE